jgi:foldase protein PrsA
MDNPQQISFEQAKQGLAEKTASFPDVLAIIDGKNISKDVYINLLLGSFNPEQFSSFMSAGENDIKGHIKSFTENEVNNHVMHLCAIDEGYKGKREDVLEDFDGWYASLKENDKNQFENHLKQQSLQLEDYRNKTADSQEQQQRLATERWVKDVIKVEVSEDEVKEAYEQGKETYYTKPPMVKVAHIPFRHDNSDEKKQECLKKATDVIEKLREGEDFNQMVRENPSSDGYLKRLGVLDFFEPGTYNEVFEKVAFSLNINELSDIVNTGDGYEIIKCLEKKEGLITPFKDLKDKIRDSLIGEKTSTVINAKVQTKKSDFVIKLFI